MSRRGRVPALALLALVSGLAAAALAARASGPAPGLGEMRAALVTAEPLRAGDELDERAIRRLELRSVPIRFLPPDAVADRDQLRDASVRAAVPAGSYLLASHLAPARRRRAPSLREGLAPVDLEVAAAAGLLREGGVRRVDVVVTREPVPGGRGGVRVVSEGARLLAIEPIRGGVDGAGQRWRATLGLGRRAAVHVIRAASFAREIRLLPG